MAVDVRTERPEARALAQEFGEKYGITCRMVGNWVSCDLPELHLPERPFSITHFQVFFMGGTITVSVSFPVLTKALRERDVRVFQYPADTNPQTIAQCVYTEIVNWVWVTLPVEATCEGEFATFVVNGRRFQVLADQIAVLAKA